MEKIIEITNVAKLKDLSAKYSQLDDSYIFSYVRPGAEGLRGLIEETPLKLGGTLLLLMVNGSPVEVEINQQQYTMKPNSLLMGFPSSVIRTLSPLPADLEMYAMFFDLKFSQGVNVNMASISMPAQWQGPTPVSDLHDDEAERISRYFKLLYDNANEATEVNTQLNKLIASSIISAIFYQLVQFYHKRLTVAVVASSEKVISGSQGARRHEYVREFMKLVHLHHTNERSVSFYADKMYISSKYLSLIVKESTGKSAAKWIDDFVLMEAKNMLRFSGKNIQQVAYALNFPTQSSFGKYFKHLTGMSPTEFQKS